MKKRTRSSVLAIVFIILIIAAGLAVAKFSKKAPEHTTEPVSQVSVEGVGLAEGKEPMSGSDTLASLKSRGKDLECQIIYERTAAEGNIEGTAFFSKGNMRTDFMVPAPDLGGKILSSMIEGGTSMYVWSTIKDKTFGFKTDTASTSGQHIDTKEPVPLTATVRYTCTEWTLVDGSVFVPPASVQFQDLGPIIKAGPEDSTLPN
jgi:hypothetical protein